jgi:hypothetical protein
VTSRRRSAAEHPPPREARSPSEPPIQLAIAGLVILGLMVGVSFFFERGSPDHQAMHQGILMGILVVACLIPVRVRLWWVRRANPQRPANFGEYLRSIEGSMDIVFVGAACVTLFALDPSVLPTAGYRVGVVAAVSGGTALFSIVRRIVAKKLRGARK